MINIVQVNSIFVFFLKMSKKVKQQQATNFFLS